MDNGTVGVAEEVRDDDGIGPAGVTENAVSDAVRATGRQVGTGNGAGSRPTQFKAKHPGPRAARRPKPAAQRPCQLLKDLRFVHAHEAWEDRTQGHRNCRELLDGDVGVFLALFARLELAFASGRPIGPTTP